MEQQQDKPTPDVGQIWKDNDQRSKGSGEFEIVGVVEALDTWGVTRQFVVVKRNGRKTRIRLDRLADNGPRGYTYIGRGR